MLSYTTIKCDTHHNIVIILSPIPCNIVSQVRGLYQALKHIHLVIFEPDRIASKILGKWAFVDALLA